MTSQSSQFPRFYVTAPTPCPYLEDQMERKVFTELQDPDPDTLHEAMTRIGFRRSQDIAYRPNCEHCTACQSVRIPAANFTPTRSQKRLIRRNADIVTTVCPNQASDEQYQLLKTYINARHQDGGMSQMSFEDYQNMVESSPVKSVLIEYRLPDGPLIGVALTDIMAEALSMVYSFFDVSITCTRRSLGTYIILDHITRAKIDNKPHVYLGYWVKDSPKMAYKRNFQPLEILGTAGWSITK